MAALMAQGIWTLVLLSLPGSNFSTLLDYFGPTSWLFYGLSSSAVIRLRYTEPDALRPFRVPLFPFPPCLVIFIAGVILVSALSTSPLYTGLALGFVTLAFPVHIFMERNGWVKSPSPSIDHGGSDKSGSQTDNVMHSFVDASAI